MILEGKYVTLRPLQPEDAARTLAWRNSKRAKFLNRGSQTVEQQKNWIETSRKCGNLDFIMEHNGEPVGMISLYDINTRHNFCEMGRLLIGEPVKVGVKPVVFEAERLILDYAFNDLGVHTVIGDVVSGNKKVVKLREYLKWHFDGIRPEHFFMDGLYYDQILISLTLEQYSKQKGTREILSEFIGD